MSPAQFFLSVLATVAVGLFVGWSTFTIGNEEPVSPVTQEEASSPAPPRVTSGFCCMAPGEVCTEVENASACFSPGGKGFNTRLDACTSFCKKIGLIMKLKNK